MIPLFYVLIVLLSFSKAIKSLEVLELQAVNFELALTNYKYAAILFYDESELGRNMEMNWLEASESLNALSPDGVLAKINGDDPEIKELTDAYAIVTPCIKVFRRGIMSDYRGPYDTAGIIKFLLEDALPSVEIITTIEGIKEKLRQNKKTVVLGFFPSEDMQDDEETAEGYASSPWGQFQSTADSLRGHVTFYGLGSEETLLKSFRISELQLPAVFLISDDLESGAGSMVPYKGEILESSLAEWILRLSSPDMGELAFNTPSGELYATQFFSSRKLKFILFFDMGAVSSQPKIQKVLKYWQNISDTFSTKALFSFMHYEAIPDVTEYFNINSLKDLPMIAAYDPVKDSKFKSPANIGLTHKALQDYVVGVMTGMIKKVTKSESVPNYKILKNNQPVKKLVGANVVEEVSREGVDVLLEVYTPWCALCRRLMPAVDILGKAVSAEPRLLIAKIDATTNDLPAHWNVKTFPTLLWFPAKDKPYSNPKSPVPRPYWEGGQQSLHDLINFIQRQGSFEVKSLRIATNEQLGSLQGDEEALRGVYEAEERQYRRNEGRVTYDDIWMDYVLGEVIYDGKRWHFALLGLLGVVIVILLITLVLTSSLFGGQKISVKKKKT